jgi:rhodanese-related sulfurtransferase
VTTEEIPEVDLDELVTAQVAGALLVDVREPAEYADAHVAGAVLIPLHEIPARADELPRDRQVLVICAVGARSAQAVVYLRQLGVDAVNVAGGTRAWVMAGRAYDTGS